MNMFSVDISQRSSDSLVVIDEAKVDEPDLNSNSRLNNNFGNPGSKEIKVISGNKVCAKFQFQKVIPSEISIVEVAINPL